MVVRFFRIIVECLFGVVLLLLVLQFLPWGVGRSRDVTVSNRDIFLLDLGFVGSFRFVLAEYLLVVFLEVVDELISLLNCNLEISKGIT